jgi:hypothetical protein
MIIEISQVLNSFSTKWACLLSNGTIVETTLKDESIGKTRILRLLKKILPETQVGSVLFYSDLVVFRPTNDFVIFVMGRFPRNIVKEKFTEITQLYKRIDKEYKREKKYDAAKLKLILFSMSLEEGPEPIFHIPKKFDEHMIYKICMKSMLTLSIEKGGATKSMISFQPFAELDSLGIIYTFHIKDKKARGGEYDCAITVLVGYEYRAIIYENYDLIERALKEIEKEIIKEYRTSKNYKKPIDAVLNKYFQNVSFETVEAADIKDEMLDEIKKLVKL